VRYAPRVTSPSRPIVFLPGASGRASFWAPVAQRLADVGRAVCLGFPGFGEEPAVPGVDSLETLLAWVRSRLPAMPFDLVAQSMGGMLAVRLALEPAVPVRRLVLVATSGGVDVARLGAADWRGDYVREQPALPRWFVDDRSDVTERLGDIRVPTLLVWAASDALSPVAVGEHLRERIPGARLVVVAGGHDVAERHPEPVAAALREHLTGE
jgi:pimeloyl-ACP methyl ester carboxylesterase